MSVNEHAHFTYTRPERQLPRPLTARSGSLPTPDEELSCHLYPLRSPQDSCVGMRTNVFIHSRGVNDIVREAVITYTRSQERGVSERRPGVLGESGRRETRRADMRAIPRSAVVIVVAWTSFVLLAFTRHSSPLYPVTVLSFVLSSPKLSPALWPHEPSCKTPAVPNVNNA